VISESSVGFLAETDDAMIEEETPKSRIAAPQSHFLRRSTRTNTSTAFSGLNSVNPSTSSSNHNPPVKKVAVMAQPPMAPNFPVSLKLGSQSLEVDLKGWMISLEPSVINPLATRTQSQVTVIGGTIFGQDCVGVCGSDLSPPIISAALNKMVRYPRLVPLKIESAPVDLPTLYALRDLVLQHKNMIEQMIETRMKEFMQFPAEDKIITLGHLLSAVHAASADVGDVGTIVHAKESLLRVCTLVVGTAKTREIVAAHNAAREREMEEPKAKRPKLAETSSPSPTSPQQHPIIRQESPKVAALRRPNPQTPLVFPDIGRLTAKSSQVIQLPPRDKVVGKLHESIYALLQNPVMRKLFYYEVPSSGIQQMVPLRLRVDFTVSIGRRIALEFVLPKTGDPTTWRARIIGACVVSADPAGNISKRQNAVNIVERGYKVESDAATLGALTDPTIKWGEIIGAEFPLQEKELAFSLLIRLAAKLPGLPKEPQIDVAGVSRLPIMRLLYILKQDARVSFRMTEKDMEIPDSDALGPHHPVGTTKSYLVMLGSGSKNPNIQLDEIDKVAATYASRDVFIQLLSRAVKASKQPPSSRDDPDGGDDFEAKLSVFDDRKSGEAR
jgi:hypothetical protein